MNGGIVSWSDWFVISKSERLKQNHDCSLVFHFLFVIGIYALFLIGIYIISLVYIYIYIYLSVYIYIYIYIPGTCPA